MFHIGRLKIKQQTLYFAYGSNMDCVHLEQRIGHVKCVTSAILPGYAFKYNAGFPANKFVAGLQVSNSFIWGRLYSVTHQQLEILDTYEGVSTCYERNLYQSALLKHPRKNLDMHITEAYFNMYVPTPAYTWSAQDLIDHNLYTRHRTQLCRPTEQYMYHILAGAIQAKVPQQYIRDILLGEGLKF